MTYLTEDLDFYKMLRHPYKMRYEAASAVDAKRGMPNRVLNGDVGTGYDMDKGSLGVKL